MAIVDRRLIQQEVAATKNTEDGECPVFAFNNPVGVGDLEVVIAHVDVDDRDPVAVGKTCEFAAWGSAH